MSTTVEHDDRPRAAGASRTLPAGARSRRSMLALTAVESGRLLRHPAVLAATALGVWLLWRSGEGTAPVLHYADIATQFALAPLAGAALLATNLAVLRPHRDGAVDLYGATRLSLARRTLSHLLSVLPLAVIGAILVVADLAWLAGMPGSVGTPHLAEAATGPALIALGGCLGVLLGRLARSVALAPLVLVTLAFGSLTLAELQTVGGQDQPPSTWLATLREAPPFDPPPAALLGRPATWHLVYLLGITVAVAALALWRSQAQAGARRRTQAAAAIVLVAALAAATAAAVAQTRPTSSTLAAQRQAVVANPSTGLGCQQRGPAVYCVFPGFEPQIALWEPTVRAVVAAVPPAAAARALPVTVAHRVGLHRLVEEKKGPSGIEEGAASGGPPVAPVGTAWGRRSVLAQGRLATGVAARLIAPMRDDGQQPQWSECGAQAVVALWLGGQASPQAAEGIRQAVTSAAARFETFVMAHDPTDDPFWSVRAGRFALALLDRPHDQIAQTLWRNWDLVTAPDTTIERLGEVLGIQPPSDTSNPGPGC